MRLSNWNWTFDDSQDWIIPSYRAEEAVWTGAIISESGEILTASMGLWDAPVVKLQLADGIQGEACVTGRDDDIGLALLRPLAEPSRTYDFLNLSSEEPTIGQRLELLHHAAASGVPQQRSTSVMARITAATGYDYIRVNAAETGASDGAVLMNRRDEIQGIVMPPPWLQRYGVGNPGEVIAIEASSAISVALPLLRTGPMRIEVDYFANRRSPLPGSPGANLTHTTSPLLENGAARAELSFQSTSPQRRPPSWTWPTLVGQVTLDGKDAPAGSILYARLNKEDQPDYWVSAELAEPGFFILHVRYPNNRYNGATVEFWMDCRRSPTIATLDFFHERLNLAF